MSLEFDQTDGTSTPPGAAHPFALRRLPPLTGLAYSHRADWDRPDEMAYIGSLVHRTIRSAGCTPSGPFTAIQDGDSAATVTNTVVVPVEDAPATIPLDDRDLLVAPGDALRLRTFSGVPAATTTFEGPQEGIPYQLGRLRRWTVEQGLRPTARYRLVILRGPMHRMSDGRRVYPNEMIWELQQELSTTVATDMSISP